ALHTLSLHDALPILPNSNSVNIALAKKAKIVTGSEMPPFFAGKLAAAGGDPKNSILTRYGGNVKVGGVTIATVFALHSNGLDGEDRKSTRLNSSHVK